MPDKKEKERRKQILAEQKSKAKTEFENSLPMSRDMFTKMFEHLDLELEKAACDDTSALTEKFLMSANVENVGKVLEWLSDHGGYCDCEILANVEEQFE